MAYQGMRISIEDTLYFAADDGVHGYELWGYNTTTDEMWMVADIRQGLRAVSPAICLPFSTVRNCSLGLTPTTTDRIVGARSHHGHHVDGRDHRQVEATRAMTSKSCTVIRCTSPPSPLNTPPNLGLQHHHPKLVARRDIHMGSWPTPAGTHFIHNDVLYFTARGVGNVHDHGRTTSPTEPWKVAAFGTDPNTHPGNYMDHLIGDTLYFDALTPLGNGSHGVQPP